MKSPNTQKKIISSIPRVPLRRCLGCGGSFDKKILIRVDNNGRGMYLCKNENCLKKIHSNKKVSVESKEEFERKYFIESAD